MRLVVALVSIVSLTLVACGPSRRARNAQSAQGEDEDDFISKKKRKKSGGEGDAGDIVGWKRVVGEEDARAFVPLFGKAARIHGCHVQENGAAVVAECDGKDIRMVRDGGKILIGCKGWGTLEQCQQLFNEIIESAKKSTSPPSGNQANGNAGPSTPSTPSTGAAFAAAPATSSSGTLKPNQTLPVAIGSTREAVRSTFGKPNPTGADFDSFMLQGLAIDYQNDLVVAVTGTYMNGASFRGQILGVGLAETYTRCIEEWGNPVSRKPSGYEFDIVTWSYAGYTIELEIWNQDSFQKSFGGDMKKDTVKRIKVRR